MILSSPLERFYIKVLKNKKEKIIKPLFFIQDEKGGMTNTKKAVQSHGIMSFLCSWLWV